MPVMSVWVPTTILLAAGHSLTKLLREREACFDARFAERFGELSSQDLPTGDAYSLCTAVSYGLFAFHL